MTSTKWSALITATVLVAASLARAVAEDAIFDVPALIATPLHPQTLSRAEHDGLVTEEVRFHSEADGDKQVEIFAYFSYPQGADKLPAYIWNPGGLGQANTAFTELGAKRGYAVLCIDFPQPGYRSTGGYPINSSLELGDDPRQAPIYHGAVALLKAVSYLESRPEVDRDRIGMAGSSWGGFFTTLMVGIDPRLKVGSCLYGTGNLQLGNAWWDGQSRNGRTPPTPAERERWRQTLDPAWRLPTKKTPIAWFTGTNDAFYLMPGLMKSYEMAAGPKHLMLLPNWDHALPATQHDDLIFTWLDVYLQGKPPLPVLSPVQVRNEAGRLVAQWDVEGVGEGDVVQADLIASYGDSGNWRARYWHTFPAKVEGKTCRAELPDASDVCYVSGSVIDERGFRTSTPLLRVDPASLGVSAAAPPVPDYDGCAQWGGFEESQVAFLARHNQSGQTRWVPQVSLDAKEGQHSAILKPDRTVLPPILSTALLPHRFRCFLKAEKPVEVTVQVAGEQKQFSVGTEWTEVGFDYTPPEDIMGDIPASITIPSGAVVLVDAISFRPVR